MNYTVIKKLPLAEEMIQSYPLSIEGHQKIFEDRIEVNNILEGKDDRLLMIIGPCSAWPRDAVLEYANRLSKLNKKVEHALKIVMRVYIQKPRTTKGWTGPINQPNPCGPHDIEAGMHYTREMMVKVINMGLPIADEALFTHNARGFLELLSWVAIGARSSEDQEHRIFASAINCAVGMKNPTHGSLSIAVNSVIAAQHPHAAVLNGYEIETHGNPHAHVVLRGSNQQPNYSINHLLELKKHIDDKQIKNPSIMIDASHDNCIIHGKKDPLCQPDIIFEVLNSINNHPDLKKLVKGFMVESYLKAGNQQIENKNVEALDLDGLSITDPCLGWDETEELLMTLAKMKG
jgi:3-deoxy-7-phosphoheptulonate synthase